MALVFCPDCSERVSEMAEACPRCGYPIRKFLGRDRHRSRRPRGTSPTAEPGSVLAGFYTGLVLLGAFLLVLGGVMVGNRQEGFGSFCLVFGGVLQAVAYVVFLVLLVVYVAIMASKVQRIERELRELAGFAEHRAQSEEAAPGRESETPSISDSLASHGSRGGGAV